MAREEHIHRHLATLAAGLLDEEDEKRWREHIAACEECSRAWGDYSEGLDSDESPGRHIPSAIIARWKTVSPDLRGLERELVRRHLAECPECRADLELLGFEPVLKGEASPQSDASTEPVPEFAARARIREEKLGHGRGWYRWVIGGWALAATAAAVLLAFLPRTAPYRVAEREAEYRVLPWVEPHLLRGVEPGELLLVSAGTQTIILVLRVPPVMQPDLGTAIEVLSPQGQTLLRSEVPSRAMKRGIVTVLLECAEPLIPGSYSVLFRPADPNAPPLEPVETRFEIQLTEP